MCCCAASAGSTFFPVMMSAAETVFATTWAFEDELDYEGVRKALARWRAWGGFIYFHLLVNALADKGIVRA